MKPLVSFGATPIVLALLATAAWAVPAERDQLNARRTMIDRAAQAQGSSAPDDAQVQKCRQIIKEWTLRDSRMSVDENGQPMR